MNHRLDTSTGTTILTPQIQYTYHLNIQHWPCNFTQSIKVWFSYCERFSSKARKNHSTLSISVQSHDMITIRKDWVSGLSGVQLWLTTKNDIQCQLINQCVKRCLSICPMKPVTINWSSFAFLKRNALVGIFGWWSLCWIWWHHGPRFHKRDHNR